MSDESRRPAAVPPILAPSHERWAKFVSAFEERLEAVVAEAESGLDALIASHPLDPEPMGAALSAIQARFHGLGEKLDAAYETIEELQTEALEGVDLDPPTLSAAQDAFDRLDLEKARLADRLELTYESLRARKRAQWGRRLGAMAEEERRVPARCAHCGAPWEAPMELDAAQFQCPHCGVSNELRRGTASALFHRGAGAHDVAHHAAFEEWLAERSARRRFQGYRHPTDEDLRVYLDAARAYWGRYHRERFRWSDEASGDVEKATEAKLRHYTAWDSPRERGERAFYGELVRAARTDDEGRVHALLREAPSWIGKEDCEECLVERRLLSSARSLLSARYGVEGSDEPREAWIAEELADLRRRTRLASP